MDNETHPPRMTWAEGEVRWSVAHAYTPNEQATYGGADHLMLQGEFVSGRLHRRAGDALCKPARRFAYLQEVTHVSPLPTCKRCLDLAPKYGIDIEKSPLVRAFRDKEHRHLVAERGRLLSVLAAFRNAPEALRERAQATLLAARSGVTEWCSYGSAFELRGMLDPARFRRGLYQPCGRVAVAMMIRAKAPRTKAFPRCDEHVDRSEGERLKAVLEALPPETRIRCWPYADTLAEILLEALADDCLENELVWEDRGVGEWTYSAADGRFVMEILG